MAQLERIRYIFFDLDGTLFPPIGGERLSRAIKELYGYQNIPDLTSPRLAGTTELAVAWGAVAKCWPGYTDASTKERVIEAEKLIRMMDEIYFDKYGNVPIWPFDGVDYLLRELRNGGYTIGVVSGNSERVGEEKLRTSGLQSFFDPDRLYWGYMSKKTWDERHLDDAYPSWNLPFTWPDSKQMETYHAVCYLRASLLHLAFTLTEYDRISSFPVAYVADTYNDFWAMIQLASTPGPPRHFIFRIQEDLAPPGTRNKFTRALLNSFEMGRNFRVSLYRDPLEIYDLCCPVPKRNAPYLPPLF